MLRRRLWARRRLCPICWSECGGAAEGQAGSHRQAAPVWAARWEAAGAAAAAALLTGRAASAPRLTPQPHPPNRDKLKELGGLYTVGPDWAPHAGRWAAQRSAQHQRRRSLPARCLPPPPRPPNCRPAPACARCSGLGQAHHGAEPRLLPARGRAGDRGGRAGHRGACARQGPARGAAQAVGRRSGGAAGSQRSPLEQVTPTRRAHPSPCTASLHARHTRCAC